MKNDKLITSWDKIVPDENVNTRIMTAILKQNRLVSKKSFVEKYKARIAVIGCVCLIGLVSAWSVFRVIGTVPDDNGNKLPIVTQTHLKRIWGGNTTMSERGNFDSISLEGETAVNEAINNEKLKEQERDATYEMEFSSSRFGSVDEIVKRVQEITMGGVSTSIEKEIKLGELTEIYAPKDNAFPEYRLLQIEVFSEQIVYYFMPEKYYSAVENNEKPIFQYDCGITVTYHRNNTVTLESLSTQVGIDISEDQILFDPERGDISFVEGDSLITIHIPESLKQYEEQNIKCVMEVVMIGEH